MFSFALCLIKILTFLGRGSKIFFEKSQTRYPLNETLIYHVCQGDVWREERLFSWPACLSSASLCCPAWTSAPSAQGWFRAGAVSSLCTNLGRDIAHTPVLQGSQFSALHLELTAPLQPVFQCSGDRDTHQHAWAKLRHLSRKRSFTASAHKHGEGWDTLTGSGITGLMNNYDLSLLLIQIE